MRMTRRITTITIILLMVAVFIPAPATAGGAPRAAGTAVAPYNTQGRWPVAHPDICLIDRTGGYPVAEAAREFEGIVNMAVDGCADEPGWFHVYVVTVDLPTGGYTGWWTSERNDADQYTGGIILLNLARDYRMTRHMWFLCIVHELGHAAGLSHTYKAHSVMDPTMVKYWSVDGLTAEDRRQLETIYG